MTEPVRKERQAGLSELAARFSKFGIHILDQNTNFRAGRTYFEIGTDGRRTDFTISGEFLDDLPNTKDYQATQLRMRYSVAPSHPEAKSGHLPD
jgi:hypothetical protein